MIELIEALQIFIKYDNPQWPTHCLHDELVICGNYSPSNMTPEDLADLIRLGFNWNESEEYFYSFRFGSC